MLTLQGCCEGQTRNVCDVPGTQETLSQQPPQRGGTASQALGTWEAFGDSQPVHKPGFLHYVDVTSSP